MNKRYLGISIIGIAISIIVLLFGMLIISINPDNMYNITNYNPFNEPINPTPLGLLIVIPLMVIIGIIMYFLPKKENVS